MATKEPNFGDSIRKICPVMLMTTMANNGPEKKAGLIKIRNVLKCTQNSSKITVHHKSVKYYYYGTATCS